MLDEFPRIHRGEIEKLLDPEIWRVVNEQIGSYLWILGGSFPAASMNFIDDFGDLTMFILGPHSVSSRRVLRNKLKNAFLEVTIGVCIVYDAWLPSLRVFKKGGIGRIFLKIYIVPSPKALRRVLPPFIQQSLTEGFVVSEELKILLGQLDKEVDLDIAKSFICPVVPLGGEDNEMIMFSLKPQTRERTLESLAISVKSITNDTSCRAIKYFQRLAPKELFPTPCPRRQALVQILFGYYVNGMYDQENFIEEEEEMWDIV